MKSALARARTILAANNVAAEGSFMYALHERDFFDEEAFWQLHDAMVVIGATQPRRRGRDTRRNATRVQQQILLHVIYHLNPHDGSRTAGFPTRNLHLWLDRLEWVFDPVVLGVPGYGPPRFDDGLRTPGNQS